MSSHRETPACAWSDRVCAYALQMLPADEAAVVESHAHACPECQRELKGLRPVVDGFASWPTDVLRPSAPLQTRLAARIAADTGAAPVLPAGSRWREPEWETVAEGIECKLLASDTQRNRISMLVRLAPGAAYPPHTHAGVEELHLLAGELWIEDRKLLPGDYNRGEPGTGDQRVWSETGCTCVLITSTDDVLG